MKQQNIVMLCQQSWDAAIDTNARNLAYELAKQNRVLYISMPLDVRTMLRRYREPDVRARVKQIVAGVRPSQVAASLWTFAPDVLSISINWLTSQQLFRKLNRLNSLLLARSIKQAIRAVGFHSFYLLQDGLIFQGLELPRLLRPLRFIYYLRDYMTAVPYFRRHGSWAEQGLLRDADLVAANSAYLRDYALPHNAHSYDIGQGCVLSLYEAETAHPEPTDLAAIAHPRIVYTGNLTALRLDLELLLTVARQRPDWQLVLVGPEDAAFAASTLHQLPNVHFLGTKTPHELAAYLQHADVCINPQLVNDITIGNYPLKIDEYLAMGKPVVATHTQAMTMFANHVYLATDTADWLRLLEVALLEAGPSTPANRVAFAHGHTWQASAEALYRALAVNQPNLLPSYSA